jgi:hypothetical protein
VTKEKFKFLYASIEPAAEQAGTGANQYTKARDVDSRVAMRHSAERKYASTEELGGHGGDRKSEDQVAMRHLTERKTSSKSSTSTDRLLARMKRDAPEIAEQYKEGRRGMTKDTRTHKKGKTVTQNKQPKSEDQQGNTRLKKKYQHDALSEDCIICLDECWAGKREKENVQKASVPWSIHGRAYMFTCQTHVEQGGNVNVVFLKALAAQHSGQ